MIPASGRLDNALNTIVSNVCAMEYILDRVDMDNHDHQIAMCALRLIHEAVNSAVTEIDILTQDIDFNSVVRKEDNDG